MQELSTGEILFFWLAVLIALIYAFLMIKKKKYLNAILFSSLILIFGFIWNSKLGILILIVMGWLLIISLEFYLLNKKFDPKLISYKSAVKLAGIYLAGSAILAVVFFWIFGFTWFITLGITLPLSKTYGRITDYSIIGFFIFIYLLINYFLFYAILRWNDLLIKIGKIIILIYIVFILTNVILYYIFNFVHLNYFYQDCNGLLDATNKDNCWVQKAEDFKNESFCENRIGEERIMSCRESVISKRGNSSECGSLPEIDGGKYRDLCYFHISISKLFKDRNICEMIKNSMIKNNCLRGGEPNDY